MRKEHIKLNEQEHSYLTMLTTSGQLKAHASGRRSGDQFCVYVGDRLVLPTLTSNDIAEIVSGKLSFDKLIRDYIQENLIFRFVETENDKIAYELAIPSPIKQ